MLYTAIRIARQHSRSGWPELRVRHRSLTPSPWTIRTKVEQPINSDFSAAAPAAIALGIAFAIAPTSARADTQVRGTSQAVVIEAQNATVEEVLASPDVAIGSVDGVADHLRRLREDFGFSSFVGVSPEVVAVLAGT